MQALSLHNELQHSVLFHLLYLSLTATSRLWGTICHKSRDLLTFCSALVVALQLKEEIMVP